MDEIFDEDGNVAGYNTRGLKVYNENGEEMDLRLNKIYDERFTLDSIYDEEGNVAGHGVKGVAAYILFQ